MPIYEYQCDACGHQLEALQKISDPLLKTCPECGKDALRKRVSAAAFRLKGGGWYETDFKDKKTRKNVAGGNDASPGSEKKESSASKQDSSGKSGDKDGNNTGGKSKTASG